MKRSTSALRHIQVGNWWKPLSASPTVTSSELPITSGRPVGVGPVGLDCDDRVEAVLLDQPLGDRARSQ